MSMQLAELEVLKLTELYKLAKKHQIPYYGTLKKKELIFAILRAQAAESGLMFMQGVLEILQEGFGFLRPINYFQARRISIFQHRKFASLICAQAISYPVNVDRRRKMNATSGCFRSKRSTERSRRQLRSDCISQH